MKQIWSWWKIDTQYFMLIWCLKTFQSCLRNVSSFYSFVSFIPLNDKIIEVVCDWCSILIQLFLGCVNSSWSAFLFFPRGVHDFSLSFFNAKTRNSSFKIVYFCSCNDCEKGGVKCQVTCQATHHFIKTSICTFLRVFSL